MAFLAAFAAGGPAAAQPGCDIPEEARTIWRCASGFVVGPEDVIVRLPIPETDPEALYRAGIEAAEREDWRAAIAYFSAAHHRAHLVPRYIYNVGLAYARAGREIPAAAWLAAYLVAAPDAPNRSAVWEQINDLTEASGREAAQLWQMTERAAALVPRAGGNGGARREAYIALTVIAAYAGEIERGRRYFANALAASTTDPGSDEGLDAFLKRTRLRALISDGDIADADLLISQLGEYPQVEQDRRNLETLRSGGVNLHPRVWPVTPAFLHGSDACECPVVDAAWSQDAAGLRGVVEANRSNANLAVRLTAFAALGMAQEAVSGLSGVDAYDRETAASNVSEVLLLTGDRTGAAQARDLAIQAVHSDRSGIWAARASALIAASEGRADSAVRRLEAALSRRGATSRPVLTLPLPASRPSWTPAGQWLEARFDPAGLIAEYLVRSGQASLAGQAEAQLDSLRRVRFYETARLAPYFQSAGRDPIALRDEALSVASGGDAALAGRRAAIERALIVAYGLPGSTYDRARWLAYVRAASTTTEQAVGLAVAAQDVPRALHRIRAEYERSGAVWRYRLP